MDVSAAGTSAADGTTKYPNYTKPEESEEIAALTGQVNGVLE
jgi:hypothetical protein